jgi:predicted nucleic acid-binding protein
VRCGLAVIGTLGVLEEAAVRGLLELPEALEQLQRTNARIDSALIQAALQREKIRKQRLTDQNSS